MVYVQMINIGQIETRLFSAAVFVWLASFMETCNLPPQTIDFVFLAFRLRPPHSVRSSIEKYPELESIHCVLYTILVHFSLFKPNDLPAFFLPISQLRYRKHTGHTGRSWNVITILCSIVWLFQGEWIKKAIELWLCHCFSTNFNSIHGRRACVCVFGFSFILLVTWAHCFSKCRFVAWHTQFSNMYALIKAPALYCFRCISTANKRIITSAKCKLYSLLCENGNLQSFAVAFETIALVFTAQRLCIWIDVGIWIDCAKVSQGRKCDGFIERKIVQMFLNSFSLSSDGFVRRKMATVEDEQNVFLQEVYLFDLKFLWILINLPLPIENNTKWFNVTSCAVSQPTVPYLTFLASLIPPILGSRLLQSTLC